MANIDLSGYNLGELKGLQHDIENAIEQRQRQETKNARERILAIAQEAGISLDELLAVNPKKTTKQGGQKVQPQYQNPNNSSQTWSGRGRKPHWVVEGVANGGKLEHYKIK